MSGSIGWKLKRLHRMGVREIAFRTSRHLGQIAEKRRVVRGWAPKPGVSVTPRRSLLPPIDQYKAQWEERYDLDMVVLDDLTSGSIELFGHQQVELSQPIDWHLDPVSGIRAPTVYGKSIDYRNAALVGDVKVIWELGRQHHLVPLAVAYAVGGDERYLRAITDQIESWINQNPFAIGIHWCSALELALRLISWSLVHSLIASRIGEEGLFAVVQEPRALGDSIYQQAWFIRQYLSRDSSANNHLFGELTGLWVASQVFDFGVDGEQWALKAQLELEEQLQLQVFSDGVDKEQALYYHLWMLEYALFLQVAGRRVGTPYSEEFCNRLAAMAEFVRDVTPDGGMPPQLGDADDGFVTRFSAMWPDDPYKEVLDAEMLVTRACIAREMSEKAFWYGVIGKCDDALKGSQTCKPVNNAYPRIYSEGGYAVLGNADSHLVFDAGSLGYLSIAAHGHADALSFTLAIDGEWWLVDPGTYNYHSLPEWRDYFRSTRAHNCVVVDEKDQSTISGPFMWSRHANAQLVSYGGKFTGEQWVRGCHDGYQDIGVIHYREIKLHSNAGNIVIFDELEGKGQHKLEIVFQCAPDIEVVKQRDRNHWALCKQGSPRSVHIQLDSTLEWDMVRGQEQPVIAGWFSSRLGYREPSWVLRGYGNCALPCRIDTSITYD